MRVFQFFSWLALFFVTACAAVPKAPLVFTHGSAIDTLSTSVSLSIHSRAGSMSGNGVMIYRRPDRFHVVMLSPFGSTVLEAFALGEQLTLVYPSQAVAYTGRFDDLPDGSGMQGWRLLRWVMDADPAETTGLNGAVERTGRTGERETVVYGSGLVTAKTSVAGDRVAYRAHELVNGVPFATELEMQTVYNDQIRLVFNDPEINVALDGAAFVPRLDGMNVLPLSILPLTVTPGRTATE
jgi:hypothetical protein